MKLLGSFNGAKDSYYNLKRTLEKWFDNRLEPLMNRLITSMVIEIDNNVRTVMILNGDGGAKFDSPASSPKPSGICNNTNIYNIDNQPKEFHTCLNYNEVAKTELLYISNKVVGILCKNNNNICIGMKIFEGITYTEPEILNFIIKQYFIFGVFCGDYELITTILGHVGPNTVYPCIWCSMPKKNFKLLPSSIPESDKKERTIQSILENVKIVEESFQEYPTHEKPHKKRLEFANKIGSFKCSPIWKIKVSVIVPLPLHIVLGVTYYYDKLIQQQLSIIDNMVKSTTDLSNKSAVKQIAETVEEYLHHCRDSASEIKNLIFGNEKKMKDFVMRIANISEVVTYQGLNPKDRNCFKKVLLSLGKQKDNCNNVSFVEREAELLNEVFVLMENVSEMKEILGAWESRGVKALNNACKENGVDKEVYFAGMVVRALHQPFILYYFSLSSSSFFS